MVKQTRSGHIKFLLLWSVDDKLISIFFVLVHNMILLDQAEGQDFIYYPGVIPDSIRISVKFTNYVVVCKSCVTMDPRIMSIGSISVS